MKKLLRVVWIAVAVAALCCAVASCSFGSAGEDPDTVRVMVAVCDGITVTGQNPVDVAPGGTATFRVTVQEGYLFLSVSDGEYDEATGTLTVRNVTKRTTVNFSVEYLGYSMDTQFTYCFMTPAPEADTSVITETGASLTADTVYAGTCITVHSGCTDRVFAGWSFGKPLASGGAVVSTDRDFTFRANPADIAEDGTFYVYANYIDTNILTYDANGGEIHLDTANTAHSEYRTLQRDLQKGTLTVTYSSAFVDFCAAVPTFWDDGTFTRPGHILREYNTRADGSGESYGPGSKVYALDDNRAMTLYCIWEQVAPASDFTVQDYTVARPVSADKAPEWRTSGVIITSYTGNDDVVAIPETVGGKPVIAIAAGAFANRDMTTLVLSRFLNEIQVGAITGCSHLETLYFPDGVCTVYDDSLDDASYTSLRNFYVNATIAPRFSNTNEGAFSIKLARIMATQDKNRIIMIAGSSSYQGLGTEYLRTLLDGRYTVVNFGTTRTTNGLLYLEAMQHFTHEGDLVLVAPENSSYMLGETELYWKTVRDIESMYNIFRYVDISHYTHFLSAFSEFNRNYRYVNSKKPLAYEDIYTCAHKPRGAINADGDYLHPDRATFCIETNYTDSYFVTLNNRYKSRFDLDWNDKDGQTANKDYTDPDNVTWCSIDDPYFADEVNRATRLVQQTGAKVYFSFCPVDADKVVSEAQNMLWLSEYDRLIADTYCFDGTVGHVYSYIFAHCYFYDCAFHPNDYGRAYRTYRLYVDLCAILGITDVHGMQDFGTDFEGCLFEIGVEDGVPVTHVGYLPY